MMKRASRHSGIRAVLGPCVAALLHSTAPVAPDMVWREDHPSEEVRQFWASEYPTMKTVSRRLEQATRAG